MDIKKNEMQHSKIMLTLPHIHNIFVHKLIIRHVMTYLMTLSLSHQVPQ